MNNKDLDGYFDVYEPETVDNKQRTFIVPRKLAPKTIDRLETLMNDRVIAELENIPLDNRGADGVWLTMSLEERDRRIKELRGEQ